MVDTALDEEGHHAAASQSWSPFVQTDKGGIVEYDDWLLRRARFASTSESAKKDDKNQTMIALDRVRCAGYDSIFIPRVVSNIDDAKLETVRNFFKLSTAQTSSALVDASLRQLKHSLQGSAGGSKHEEQQKSVGKGSGKCFRKAAVTMGCACEECIKDIEASNEAHEWWEGEGKKLMETLPSVLHKEYNPQTFSHFDHYVLYDGKQVLPRYLVSFTVTQLAPPIPAPPPPCWMCSEPENVVLSQTSVLLHLTEQPVPMCFACASRSAVPARPEILAPATEELLDSYGSRALVLNWSEPTCPAPIDMYALQVAAMPQGTEDPSSAGPWQELFSDFAVRSVAISPATPDTRGVVGVQSRSLDKKGTCLQLSPGTYCFRVRARSSAGWGDWSKEV